MKRVTDPTETQAITSFFVANFWAEPISKPGQRQQLETEVYKDLTTRYVQAGNQVRTVVSGCSCAAFRQLPEGGCICSMWMTQSRRGRSRLAFSSLETRGVSWAAWASSRGR